MAASSDVSSHTSFEGSTRTISDASTEEVGSSVVTTATASEIEIPTEDTSLADASTEEVGSSVVATTTASEIEIPTEDASLADASVVSTSTAELSSTETDINSSGQPTSIDTDTSGQLPPEACADLVCAWDEVAVLGELGCACEPGRSFWRTVGGPDGEQGIDIQPTPDGLVQVLANPSRTVAFDAFGAMIQHAATGNRSPFALSAAGHVITFSGSEIALIDRGGVEVSAIAVSDAVWRSMNAFSADSEGNVYRVSARDGQLFIEKYKASGALDWAKKVIHTGGVIERVLIDQREDYVAVAADFRPQGGQLRPDVYLLRINGDEVWRKQLPSSSGLPACVDVDVDLNGNVSLLENAGPSRLITSWDVAGAELWSAPLSNQIDVYAIARDDFSNTVVAGYSDSAAWAQKFDALGEARWVSRFDISLGAAFKAVAADASGDFWFTGSWQGDLLVARVAADAPDTPVCEHGSYAVSNDVEATCEPWTSCLTNEYSESRPSPFQDRECTACPLGTRAQPYCFGPGCCPKNYAVCGPGTYVVTPGTEWVFPVCAACPVGSYSTIENATECLMCPEGMTSQGGASECRTVNQCAWDETAVSNSIDGVDTDGSAIDEDVGEVGERDASVADDSEGASFHCEAASLARSFGGLWVSTVIGDEHGGLFLAQYDGGDVTISHVDASGNSLWVWSPNGANGSAALYYHAASDSLYVGLDNNVARLDATGSVIAEWRLDFETGATISDLLVDEQHQLYVSGAARLPDGSGTYGFVNKLDETGTKTWSFEKQGMRSGGIAPDFDFFRLDRDAAGNVYGVLRASPKLWSGAQILGIYKWNAQGEPQWEFVKESWFPEPFSTLDPTDAVVTAMGETYVTMGAGGLVKLDAAGSVAWYVEYKPALAPPVDAWGVPHEAGVTLTALATDDSGRLWVGGHTNGVVTEPSRGQNDAFVLEYSGADAQLQNARQYGGAADEKLVAITLSGDGLFVAGNTTARPMPSFVLRYGLTDVAPQL